MHAQQVRDLMTPDVVTVGPDTSFKRMVQLLAEHRIDALPVVDGGRLRGVVSASDLTAHDEQPPPRNARTAEALMSAPARCVGPEVPVAEALREMTRMSVGRLVVVDDQGAVVGILARSDVLKVYLRDDADLERQVREAVRGTIQCDADVQVQVHDGVVTMTGWVEQASCGWAASSAARAVPGVVDLDEQVTYRVDDTLVEQVAMRQYI